MGWCSGTEVFDTVVGGVLNNLNKKEVIKLLIEALWSQDWDCESESCYYSNATVRQAFKELKEE